MLWFGQAQVEGWLVGQGWRPLQATAAWQRLAVTETA